MWREIQLRANTFISLSYGCPPVYWCDSLHWLKEDGSVLAFDTQREAAILINCPQFIDHFEFSDGNILIGGSLWLGKAQGLLTLVSLFRKCKVIATYNNASNSWSISHISNNFLLGP